MGVKTRCMGIKLRGAHISKIPGFLAGQRASKYLNSELSTGEVREQV